MNAEAYRLRISEARVEVEEIARVLGNLRGQLFRPRAGRIGGIVGVAGEEDRDSRIARGGQHEICRFQDAVEVTADVKRRIELVPGHVDHDERGPGTESHPIAPAAGEVLYPEVREVSAQGTAQRIGQP